MCGRFSLGTPATTLARQFDLFETPALSDGWLRTLGTQ
jgi:hypothetical protein